MCALRHVQMIEQHEHRQRSRSRAPGVTAGSCRPTRASKSRSRWSLAVVEQRVERRVHPDATACAASTNSEHELQRPPPQPSSTRRRRERSRRAPPVGGRRRSRTTSPRPLTSMRDRTTCRERVLHEHVLEAVEATRGTGRRRARPSRAAGRRAAPRTAVSFSMRRSKPRSIAPPPTRWMPSARRSCDELGRRPRERLLHRAEDRLDRLVDRLADLLGRRARPSCGMPLMRSRPRTSALYSSSVGNTEPIASLISSAVRSPIARPYSRRT